MPKGFDPKCAEIAEYFLSDVTPTPAAADISALAQVVQDAIEDHMTAYALQVNTGYAYNLMIRGGGGRDVTGREVLKDIAGDGVVDALYARGYMCVPRIPTQRMLYEAKYAALGEDAGEVWEEMIQASEITEESETPVLHQ